MRVFISSTLRNDWNREYNVQLCERLQSRGIECFLPQREADTSSTQQIFVSNIVAIREATAVLSLVLNESPSLGVEAGYAYGINKTLVLLIVSGHTMPDMFAGMDEPSVRMVVPDLDDVDSYIELLDRPPSMIGLQLTFSAQRRRRTRWQWA